VEIDRAQSIVEITKLPRPTEAAQEAEHQTRPSR
jgi:hypothetical protein